MGESKVMLADQFHNYATYMRKVREERGEAGVTEIQQQVLRAALLDSDQGVAPLHILLDMCGIYDTKRTSDLSDREFAMVTARRQVGYTLLELLKIF